MRIDAPAHPTAEAFAAALGHRLDRRRGLVIGLGTGQLQTPVLIVMQSVVDWRSRGATTALNQFSRTIGGAVGVSLLGLGPARHRARALAIRRRHPLGRGTRGAGTGAR